MPQGREPPTAKISLAPGWRLRRWSAFLFPKKVFSTVIEPGLSDTQEEYFEALHAQEWGKARLIQWRGYFSFWQTILLVIPFSVIDRAKEIKKILR